MKHRNIDYDVREVEPGRWRWLIEPMEKRIIIPKMYRSRDLAVAGIKATVLASVRVLSLVNRFPRISVRRSFVTLKPLIIRSSCFGLGAARGIGASPPISPPLNRSV